MFPKIPRQSAWEFCLSPLGVGCFSGNCYSSELNSLQFWTSDTHKPATSYRKFLYIISCLCLAFCTQKCSLADTFNHLTVSPDLSNKRGSCLPYLHPSWIYCIENQHKVSLFWGLFFCLFFLHSLLLWHGLCFPFTQVFCLHGTQTITASFLQNADCPDFKLLTSHSRSGGMPLVSPRTATNSRLSNNVSADLPLL